ncbi:cytochrome b/b6 domain-containing protein [Pseudorhodobacter sp.]|uniref:cytochrome b/b6 domain-containing protein n=1 Tax=Pseudorhodobacter sp. TaxID=1934400 RepID=UPI002648EEF8|nr:cytochrome b/b6 domain-containing protein [Pseudorhodobacter sp.]MDN5788516.1 cytochrome b/b6 domain-containing protein [Pseudorhodobacter sp.]
MEINSTCRFERMDAQHYSYLPMVADTAVYVAGQSAAPAKDIRCQVQGNDVGGSNDSDACQETFIGEPICEHCANTYQHGQFRKRRRRPRQGCVKMTAVQPLENSVPQGGDLVYRHRLSTRIWHWINVVVLFTLLMSGLMIFNAHPRLYWGEYGANTDPAWFEIGSRDGEGYTRIGTIEMNTAGILGSQTAGDGRTSNLAFPGWATLPTGYNLGLARRWHLTFAWAFSLSLILYMVWSFVNGHFRRDLLPKTTEITPQHIWSDIKSHARLRFPRGAAALNYNILQKTSYIGVIFVLIPAMILTGLTMSPSMDATWPWLLDLFGGRQSARSIHFITATLLVLFILVHLIMVLLAGPFNEVRSMITGRFRLPREKR